jgi:DNA-binding protein YbaB
MMGKLKETQNKIEETKKRYCSCWWTSIDGLKVTTNRKVKSITIADELLADKEQLEDYMILVLKQSYWNN